MYTINGKNYRVLAALERITSKDSFTHQENKIGTAAGAWEWHIGSKNDLSMFDFFNGHNFSVRCFLKKSDLVWLMNELYSEYQHPSQLYRGVARFHELWNVRMNEINTLSEFEFFLFREHDRRDPIDQRLYAKRPGTDAEGDEIYGLIRKIALPNLTFISILKLIADDGELLYYFKIFPEFYNEEIEISIDSVIINEINESPLIQETEKDQLIKSRIGQGIFRSQLIEECKFCPITGIDDSRILVASHIKPWRISTNRERLYVKNGLLFTPTFDKLFDFGFITFTNEKRIIISPWISQENIDKLRITNNQEFPLLPIEGREDFLNYHRTIIFKV